MTYTHLRHSPSIKRNMYFFVPRIVITLLIVLLLIVINALILKQAKTQQIITQHAAATGKFYVLGNKIIDPKGNQFIVKGVNDRGGPWLPLPDGGYSQATYKNALRDFDLMKSIGINLIRIWFSASYRGDTSKYSQLANVVNWAGHRGIVIEITNGIDNTNGPSSRGIQNTNALMQYLAATYKNHPYVWLEPLNEPECESASETYCNDWSRWHTEQSRFVQIIRGQGFNNPIVVNTPWWSIYLTQHNLHAGIDNPSYRLSDSNIIYAAHRYSFKSTSWYGPGNSGNDHGIPDSQDCDHGWANYANRYAIIADEFGPMYNGVSQRAWMDGFLDYLANWVNTRGGSGAVAFLWFWSDGNSMTGTSLSSYNHAITFTWWGNDYKTRYLNKVPSSILGSN